jgi:hypothetical protein
MHALCHGQKIVDRNKFDTNSTLIRQMEWYFEKHGNGIRAICVRNATKPQVDVTGIECSQTR